MYCCWTVGTSDHAQDAQTSALVLPLHESAFQPCHALPQGCPHSLKSFVKNKAKIRNLTGRVMSALADQPLQEGHPALATFFQDSLMVGGTAISTLSRNGREPQLKQELFFQLELSKGRVRVNVSACFHRAKDSSCGNRACPPAPRHISKHSYRWLQVIFSSMNC